MSNIICHFNKIKGSSDMASKSVHNSRSKIFDSEGNLKARHEYLTPEDPWPPAWLKIAPEMKNEGTVFENGETIGEKWAEAVEKAQLHRKPQNNASRGFEAILTASDGSFKTVADWKKFLEEFREKIFDRYGRENVLQWNFHFDEKTPHCHILFVPILRDVKYKDGQKINKYTSKNFLGGPEGLRKLQTFVYEEVGKKYGLIRGASGSEKKHNDYNQWKMELQKEEKKLNEEKNNLEETIKYFDQYKKEKFDELKKEKIEIEKIEKQIEAEKNSIVEIKNNLNSMIDKAIDEAKGPNQKLQITASAVLSNEQADTKEISLFWKIFFIKVPDFMKEILKEAREILKKEKIEEILEKRKKIQSGVKRH